MTRKERLRRLLSPARVAWFGGAGIAPGIAYMRHAGYCGEAIAVNPTRNRIAGLACVRSVATLPWTPDLAVLVIPGHAVIETVRALARIRCGAVICITSGFAESPVGGDLQASLVAAAGEMPVIGPNCPGIANFLDGCAFMMDHFGTHAPKRGVAVISNGGAYLSDIGCADRSQPVACLIGLGNQSMISVADMLDVVLDDPRITAVNIYFEGLNDVASLSRAAARAARKGIPVVALKGGRTESGTRAARSHTASLASDAAISSALFRRFGWIEVTTPAEAIETVKMLSYTPLPAGISTGLVTSSGTYAVLGGDLAETLGLSLGPPDPATIAETNAALPGYVGAANPLDISDAHGWSREDQLQIYRAFARNGFDLLIQVMCYPPEDGTDRTSWDVTTSALAEAKGTRPAAFVNTLVETLPRHVRQRMIANGVAPLQGLEDGLRAVAHVARFGALRHTLVPDAMVLDAVPPARPCQAVMLDEAAAKTRLAEAGLDVPERWVVSSPGDVPDVTCPCAIKALVPGLVHKTDASAVALDIPADDLRGALLDMQERLHSRGLCADRFLIEEMVGNPVCELLVGVRRHPGIGITLTLATGGVAVELMKDSVHLILPVTHIDIETALRSLRMAPLFFGHRGRPAVDLALTIDAIAKICAFVRADQAASELEINPLLLTPTRAVVADVALTQLPQDIP